VPFAVIMNILFEDYQQDPEKMLVQTPIKTPIKTITPEQLPIESVIKTPVKIAKSKKNKSHL
jgi:hypothetical protein